MELAFFFVLAIVTVVAAIGVVVSRNAAHSALFLLVNFCTLAGLYILLNAQFIAVAQIIVYAGAIVVLFLFVVMLLGAERREGPDTRPYQRYVAIVLALVLLVEVGYILTGGFLTGPQGAYTQELIAREGNVQVVGRLLFTDFLLPFELASVLLLVAIVGAVVLAKKKL
jgi:NADH-quinone oxidoreductase subunit J